MISNSSIIILLILALLSWPLSVMTGAKLLNVEKRNFGAALFSVTLIIIFTIVLAVIVVGLGLDAHPVITDGWIAPLVGSLVSILITAYALKTNFLYALLIQIISGVIMAVIFLSVVFMFGMSLSIEDINPFKPNNAQLEEKQLEHLQSNSQVMDDE